MPDSRRRNDPAVLAAQLYDEWHGYYILRKLINGQWVDVRRVERAEAETLLPAVDEGLLIVMP